jgi:hypothetical protein
MQRPRLPWTTLLVVLAAGTGVIQVVAGEIAVSGTIHAASIHSSESPSLDGRLIALLQEQRGTAAGGADARFFLNASHVRVETDATNPTIHPAGNAGVKEDVPAVERDNAVVAGTEIASGYRWNLFPVAGRPNPTLAVAAPCADVTSSSSASIERPSLVDPLNRPALKADASTAISWQACSTDVAATIVGDFELSLWAWNATLTSDGQTDQLTSGHGQVAVPPPGVPDTTSVVSRDQQLFIFVTGGTLTIPALRGDQTTVLVASGAGLSSDSTEFRGATGSIRVGGIEAALHGTATMNGPIRMTLTGTAPGSPIDAGISGSPQAISVDGEPLAVPGASSNGGLGALAPVLLLAVAIMGLAALILALDHKWLAKNYAVMDPTDASLLITAPKTRREARGVGAWSLARKALVTGHQRRALFFARKAMRAFPRSVDTRLMLAVTFHKLDRLHEALEVYERVYPEVPAGPDKAEVASHCARANARLGDQRATLSWLKELLANDVSAFRAEAEKPAYDGLVDDHWFQTIRRGLATSRMWGHAGDPSFV